MAISALTVFSTFFLLLLFTTATLSEAATDTDTTTYIIRTRSDLRPSAFPSLRDWYSSSLHSSDNILHVYKNAFHGFSAVLTDAQASLLRAQPFVLSVLPDRARRLHTTQSSRFLGLLNANSRLLAQSDYGDDVIVAVLDSGIDPKHRSFGDVGLGPVPPRWNGTCQAGPSFPAGSCNRKLVGARFYASGFKAATAHENSTAEVLSPYDSDGHGTHTASTAAGRSSRNASLFGHASGTASGVAPRARLAVYKVCWTAGCFNSDILAAIDDAVSDGANVISLSLGSGPVPYHLDPIAIAAFAATAKGVLVSASAGNDGPGEMTATNIAPWIATVGAGSIDRSFPADVVLGDGTVVAGVSIHTGSASDAYFPLVYAGNVSTSRVGYHSSAPFCMPGSLDPDLARGKVVLCERGAVPRAEKGLAVREAGGAGMIVANQMIDGQGLVPDAHLLPAVAVGATEGIVIHAYIAGQSQPRVRFVFHGTRLGVKPAPVVASFSGRGPNAVSDYLVKPDLIAPGVGILAAWTDSAGPTGLSADARRTQFNVLSGTSMACPHVSGIAALLKGAHPEWSPAAIKSAMMTSARVTDNLGRAISDESSGNGSTGWVVGSGQVDPERAVNPGLVYDLTADDYVDFLCGSNYTQTEIRTVTRRAADCSRRSAPWDLNYPSISVVLEEQREAAGRLEEVTVRRTVTNVGRSGAEYSVDVRSPAGSVVTVEPSKLTFAEGGAKLGFVVKISAEERRGGGVGSARTEFGSITWRDGKHVVRSPVAVTWRGQY
ncbi:uncharacterized protein M6B38_273880 [Iris pallida]|uniref:Uncharacterized protein n=1 Tax=Iris pallida TaxID=29817 RepID=A0AAX6I5T3_IRIPA|nr:uncharacterized protein M6B38_273880 [Iris pallida]